MQAPTGPSVLGGTASDLAILSPGSNQARFYEFGAFDGKLYSKSTLRTGPEPIAAVVDDFIPNVSAGGLRGFELAVADRLTGQLQLLSRGGGRDLRPVATVPLGPEPTAAIGHGCCVPLIFATTAGDDRLTLLSRFKDGEFSERRSFPVGSRPSAVALGDFVSGDYEDEEVAVANRGSDDVTILLSDGQGGFLPSGTYAVGEEPVALAKFDFNRSFGPGGPGEDRIDAGSGDSRVLARDAERDLIECGRGRDVALVDTVDKVRNCERVQFAG